MWKKYLHVILKKRWSACHGNEMFNQQSAFQDLLPTLPMMQRSHWVTSLEAVYQIACSFLWSHENLYPTFFHTCSRTPQKPVNTLKYVKLVEFPFNRKCPCLHSTTSHKEILYFLNYIHVTAVVSYFASIMLRYRQGRIMPKALCVAAGCLVVLLAFTLW